MIQITKGREPQEWTEYRNTPGVDYQAIPELVESLLREQGYLCAYCMRRVPCWDKISSEDHHIEHLLSRENHDDRKLDYRNMVICCPGHIGDEDHCDRLKKSRDITFSPFDANFIGTLSYRSDGDIVSSDEQYDREINDVLNLNTPLLKENRKSAWEGVKQALIKDMGGKPWRKSVLEKYLGKYTSMRNHDGHLQYTPYCGIVIYFLRKKIRQLQ